MSAVIHCAVALALSLIADPRPAPPPAADPARVTEATAICRDLPRTLTIDPMLRKVVVDICRRAPTFRRQLLRIAAHPGLVVTIDVWRFHRTAETHASTAIKREHGQLCSADVRVRIDTGAVVELIAHELEHIMEQLDGVDLSRWVGQSGVHRAGGGHRPAQLETARAREVGRLIAAEYAATRTTDGRQP